MGSDLQNEKTMSKIQFTKVMIMLWAIVILLMFVAFPPRDRELERLQIESLELDIALKRLGIPEEPVNDKDTLSLVQWFQYMDSAIIKQPQARR